MMSIAMAAETTSSRDAIVVEGNRRVDAETIRSYFHAAPGGRYDDASRDAALKSLIATGLFANIAIDRAGDKLVVRVTEAPVLARVAFEGNKKVKDTDLSAAIESRPRGALQRATVQSDANRIVEIYRRAGRDQVIVKPEIIDRGNGSVDLVYAITEGTKTPVRKVEFTGNRTFGSRQLHAVIKTSAHSMLSFLTGGDAYDPDRIAQDRELLRTYYRSKGYADASVTSARAEYDPAQEGFTVTFAIDEGQPYKFGDVNVICNIPGVDTGLLSRVASIRNGARFDGNALDKTTEQFAIELSKLGYPFAHATPRITRDQAAQRIDISFVIEQGPRTYVERIEIHGNSRTRDYVIRREFDFGEGDPYNKTLIDRAERRLKSLSYFKTVKISSRPGSSPDRVVLDVETIDQPTGDINFAGGYGTTDGWLGEVKISERNLYGTGLDVRAAATFGQYARSINLSASEPYFLGTRVAAGIELFGRQSDPSYYQSYGSATYGGALVFGTPLTEQLGVQWRYSLYNQNITLSPNSNGLVASLPIQQAAAAGSAWVSQAGTTTTFNTLDNNKSPTSGIRSQLSQDIAGLGGDVRFLRTTSDTRYYHQLNSDVVAMVRGQGGYITGWGGQQAPLMNTFFGGPTMVRGFAPYGFGPRDLTSGSTRDNVGGSMYFATTAELQSSIPGVPDEYGLKATAFVDAGSVFGYRGPTSFSGQSIQVADKNIVRSSVGVGLTWASPFGALTVDYAVPLSKAAYDVVQPLRFSAGGF
ncbi:MAG: outer membrane protein assembly factor BamA [Bradyrhizobium sp.]|nr:outer membrane protein assembly factor BamA [Bradyrhizobium sp.]MBI5318674.1 outer membrane protein assembly factor BamA [Bradyrhizobium sp.]